MSEIEVVADNSEIIAHEVVSAINKALERIGIVAEAHAVGYETAVDTGRLRNSITHAVDSGGKYVEIGTNVEYAPYIELGHHGGGFSGLHFLTRAASDHALEYKGIFEEELKNA